MFISALIAVSVLSTVTYQGALMPFVPPKVTSPAV